MKKLLLLLLVLLVIAVVVVVLLPARLVLEKAMPANAPVQLEDVSGTVWKGRAGRVLRNGDDLGVLGWKVHPRSLLSGVIDADVILDGPVYRGQGRVARAGDGTLRMSDVDASFPASRLEPMLDIPALNLLGQVEVKLDTLELQNNRVPTALKGSARWRDAAVSGQEQATFGTLVAEFGPLPGGGFGGTLGDEGGPLAAEGEFRTTLLGYEARATLRARNDNPQVLRALRHIGQPQADGSVMFHVQGGLGSRR